MVQHFAPPHGHTAFVGLIDAILARQEPFGVILQRNELTIADLDKLCLQWISESHRLAGGGEPLRQTIFAALALAGVRTPIDQPIDDSVFETVVSAVGSARPPLPFQQATPKPGAPPAAPFAAPALSVTSRDDELMDAMWGATVAVSAAQSSEPATPFEAETSTLSLEQCARIAALLVVDAELAARELDQLHCVESVFRAHDSDHRRDALDRLGRGDDERCATYDRLYVATLEEGRGVISDEDYARIVVASERGSLQRTLSALAMPNARFGCIERHRLTRMAADPDLFMTTMDVVRAARQRSDAP